MAPLRLLRLYLDPLAPFKNVNVGSEKRRAAALRYNVRSRGALLSYARRWALIAAACLCSANSLAAAAKADPALCLPFVGAELGFSLAFIALIVSIAIYMALGAEKKRAR
jgi:hypothetical protein